MGQRFFGDPPRKNNLKQPHPRALQNKARGSLGQSEKNPWNDWVENNRYGKVDIKEGDTYDDVAEKVERRVSRERQIFEENTARKIEAMGETIKKLADAEKKMTKLLKEQQARIKQLEDELSFLKKTEMPKKEGRGRFERLGP